MGTWTSGSHYVLFEKILLENFEKTSPNILLIIFEHKFQVLLELLALDFPDRHQCGVFDNRAKKSSIDIGNSTEHASSSDTAQSTAYSDEEVPQKLDGEKCSIDEEVVLLRQIRSCVHKEQV